jgi:hypothetical protein
MSKKQEEATATSCKYKSASNYPVQRKTNKEKLSSGIPFFSTESFMQILCIFMSNKYEARI